MDDSCAVCAEVLEWVAYGSCGHREVCSTCVIRLRFVCDDRRCCICKTESNIIFITKALGDFTRVINDFSVFPANAKEGRVGEYWYHEGTQAYFDDLGHYKMIKAMCRLSCSVCDNKIDEQRSERPKRQEEFKNIDQLNNHLLHRHRLLMCSLCLEGRKIFICEHKLYSKSQLNQHMKAGDSEVDGSESERGGFSGHPFCEFCRDPFYGDNELYTHMSTEHFTCHICQRQNPGKYVYYKNYDDLEIHFRQLHFLCEDESCLAKKFIVFTNESEMKRHNALEHGGNMSRSKRNANLQIPTSFQYRRDNEQNRRGRRNFHPDSSDFQLSLAIQASLETNTATRPCVASSTVAASSNHPERNAIDSIVNPFELLATSDSGNSARNRQSLNLGNGRLAESFPPLPMASRNSRQHSKTESGHTMASRLRSRNSVNILNKARPQSTFGPTLPSGPPSHFQQKSVSVGNGEHVGSSYAVSTSTVSATAYGHVSSNFASSSSSNFASSSSNLSAMSKVGQSASASNRGGTGNSSSNFPPISSVQTNRSSDVQAANKSLIEKIRAALESDEEKFKAFKEVSTKFRKGVSDASEYLASVQQFGLSHLVVELASLCPDVEKQKDLLETYNYNVRGCFNGNSPTVDSGQSKNKKGKRKGKEKCEGIGVSVVKDDLAVNSKISCGEEPDVLSIKGKSKVLVNNEQVDQNPSQRESSNQNGSLSAVGSSKQVLVSGGGGNKQRKKSSKFLRARLGESSAAASFSDAGRSEPSYVPCEAKTNGNKGISNGLPVGGVWGNGGGRKLVAMTKRGTSK